MIIISDVTEIQRTSRTGDPNIVSHPFPIYITDSPITRALVLNEHFTNSSHTQKSSSTTEKDKHLANHNQLLIADLTGSIDSLSFIAVLF